MQTEPVSPTRLIGDSLDPVKCCQKLLGHAVVWYKRIEMNFTWQGGMPAQKTPTANPKPRDSLDDYHKILAWLPLDIWALQNSHTHFVENRDAVPQTFSWWGIKFIRTEACFFLGPWLTESKKMDRRMERQTDGHACLSLLARLGSQLYMFELQACHHFFAYNEQHVQPVWHVVILEYICICIQKCWNVTWQRLFVEVAELLLGRWLMLMRLVPGLVLVLVPATTIYIFLYEYLHNFC